KKTDDNQTENNKSNHPENNSDGQSRNNGESNSNNSPQTTASTSKSTSKFDFEPGKKVLYFDNFDRLNIGDFPAEFNTNASGEVVNISGKSGKWLSMTKNGA